MLRAVLLVQLGLLCSSTREQPVYDSLSRTIGPIAEFLFDLEVNPSALSADCGDKLCFQLTSSVSSDGPRIRVVATNEAELGYGAAYYLRKLVYMSFSWTRAGGNNVKLPLAWPAVNGTILVKKTAKYTYYQNVCTESYSMWWWGWARWEKELDWMNQMGINIALAYVGQEQIYSNVFSSFGVDDMRTTYFNGPAYLAWSRGQGTNGMGGPLPAGWMQYQVQLQKNITNRMRDLGIVPILSAFQGVHLCTSCYCNS
jgi:alpha-N-acetylglucosaminidase